MTQQFFADTNGAYIGSFDGAEPPEGAIEVPSSPAHASDTWDGSNWNPAPPTDAQVMEERDRRIRAPFAFGGKMYACDQASLARITGAASLAGFAMAAGASPGDLLWHGGADAFEWIAEDNSLTPMDAQTMFAFGRAAAANESAHIFAARSLKDVSPIPSDFAADKYWP